MGIKPVDTMGRAVKDLRISVTDRCNFRCTYCMPKEIFNRDYQFLSREQLLSFEEIELVTQTLVDLGVTKVRLTGGEPLLRKRIEQLISRLSTIEGVEDLTLTTNGALLAQYADRLASAGLDRVTVSLDALDNETFMAMNDVGFPVEKVLEGIEAAAQAGLSPIKVNMVVQRGVNDDSVLDMVRYFRGTGHILRMIEYMDVGTTNGWRMEEVMPAAELVEIIDAEFPLEPIDPNYRGEVAQRYRFSDGEGEIGMIASVTQPFCGDCTRIRLSADGFVYTCLFASGGTDLRPWLRDPDNRTETERLLSEGLNEIWSKRSDRYSELRSAATPVPVRVEMSYIGG